MKVVFGAQWTSLKTPWQKEPAANQQPILPLQNQGCATRHPPGDLPSPGQQNVANNVPSRSGVFLPSVYKA